MKVVLTYGTFDLLHPGHIRILKKAKALGDFLIVGLSTDEFNTRKHKRSFLDFAEREEILEAIIYVDKILPEECWEQKIEDVKNNNVDVFVMGDDWKGEFDFLNDYCEVVYLERTPDISTTQLKKEIFRERNN
jgi:glycerol-3-phosphate cytidylyltransferase